MSNRMAKYGKPKKRFYAQEGHTVIKCIPTTIVLSSYFCTERNDVNVNDFSQLLFLER